MSVIVEFSISAEDFILGKALRQTTGLSVELEKMIPMGATAIPYFWVTGESKAEFSSVLKQEEELSSFEVVDDLNGQWLYRAEWDQSVDTFVQAMVSHDAVLQKASGDAESWQFQLRFPDSHQLSEFHTHCREQGINLTVESLYNPIEPATVEVRDLTTGQRSLIEQVHEQGYFEVPRKVTLVKIAEELGISDQAVNERLRRGLNTLIEATLKPSPGSEE